MESLIPSRSTEGFNIRKLEIEDYNKGFCELLSNLTVVGNLTEETFQAIFNRINSKPSEYFIIVFEDTVSEKLVAHGTLLVEEKFIHAGGKVGHIEDIVVAKGCQGRGLGKQLVTLLVDLSRELGCYKVILDCKEELKGFYEGCGLEQRSIEMVKYHNSFFVHQPPNVLLKCTTEHIQDETFQAQEIDQIKLKIRRNPFANDSDSDEEEYKDLEVITYVSYENIWCTSVHFYINVIRYEILASEVAQKILNFIMTFGPVQHIFIVKPNQATADDFTLGVEGALFGILMENATYAKPFLLKENKIEIPDLGFVAVFPGSMGEDVWNKFQKETNYLQGFFFVGKDMVDYKPGCLCYFASLPKGSFHYRIAQEIRSHNVDEPLHMIRNPLEEKSIMRLEFREEKSVNTLLKICMKINNKPIIILPCLDRTPVEEIYKAYEVLILGYNQTLHTGELLKALVNNFGPVVELVLNAGINNNGNQCTLVVFQTTKAVETCLKRGEIMVKKLRLRFEAVTRPYRLTGRMVFTRVYNSDPPVRPLEIIPSPYSFTEPLEE